MNFGVSRKSGGVVRAPGNAGDKRVNRERGNRSVVAVAAQVERGCMKRTAGSTACLNLHGDSGGLGSDGCGHPAAERTSTTTIDGGDGTRTGKRKTRTASADHGEHAKTARAGRSGRHTGDRKASNASRLEWRVSQDMCEGPKCGKVEKHRGVYWLPCSATEHGWSAVVPKSKRSKVSYRRSTDLFA